MSLFHYMKITMYRCRSEIDINTMTRNGEESNNFMLTCVANTNLTVQCS